MSDDPTPAEFRAAWQRGATATALVRFDETALRRCGADESGVQFLVEAGLPSWAEPHLHFEFAGGDALPPPVDRDGSRLFGLPAGAGTIGSTGEDWPIWLSPEQPGLLLCRTLEKAPRTLLLNTSAPRLAACLLVFASAVEAALVWGEDHGEEDAWRRRVYPVQMDHELRAALAAIDAPAMQTGSYWHRWLCDLGFQRAVDEQMRGVCNAEDDDKIRSGYENLLGTARSWHAATNGARPAYYIGTSLLQLSVGARDQWQAVDDWLRMALGPTRFFDVETFCRAWLDLARNSYRAKDYRRAQARLRPLAQGAPEAVAFLAWDLEMACRLHLGQRKQAEQLLRQGLLQLQSGLMPAMALTWSGAAIERLAKEHGTWRDLADQLWRAMVLSR